MKFFSFVNTFSYRTSVSIFTCCTVFRQQIVSSGLRSFSIFSVVFILNYTKIAKKKKTSKIVDLFDFIIIENLINSFVLVVHSTHGWYEMYKLLFSAWISILILYYAYEYNISIPLVHNTRVTYVVLWRYQ